MLRPSVPTPGETSLEALFDVGSLVRWLHLLSAVAFAGLALALDWFLGPMLLGPRGGALLPLMAPRLVGLLRLTGAVAWVTGMAYGLGWLARQDPEGTWHWLTATQRGQWIGIGGALATLAVFVAWFVLGPCWEQLAAAARERASDLERDRLEDTARAPQRDPLGHPARESGDRSAADAPDTSGWQRGAVLGARLTAALVLPLVFAMGAARHLGDTGASLPTSFATAAAVVTAGGLALGLLIGAFLNRLARRSSTD
jgi:hypothetical protein